MKKSLTILLLVCFLILVATSFSAGGVAADNHMGINEVRIDQPGTDNDEYFELFGPAAESLNSLTYIVIGDGAGVQDSGVIEVVVPLAGQSINASGFFVAAEATFTLGTPDMVTTLNFENGDNVTHMLVDGFSGADGDDLDTNDDGVLDVQPWTSVVSKIAIIKEENPPTTTEWHYGPPTVGPDGNFVPGHSYLCPDELGWQIGNFNPVGGKDSPGAANPCIVIPPAGICGDEATKIHDVQGDGAGSPLVGQIVTVEAVVHGDFQEINELDGFFLQEEDEDADANPLTSEGIFIDDTSLQIGEGDVARVQGEVEENFGRTQLANVTSIESCSTENTVTPASLMLPVESVDNFEKSEGMSVMFAQVLYATDNFNQGRFGEVGLAVGSRLIQPTNVVYPGDPANALQAANDLRRILLDDGSGDQNPVPAPYFAADGTLRAGDTVTGLQGAMDYGFGRYRIQPTEDVTFTRVNERPAVPDTSDMLTVASFNVLNYFTTLDSGVPICGPSGDLDCRGADNEAEFVRQRTKIIDALSRMDADVVGLTEIENNAKAAVEDLVMGLNDKMGAGTYAYIDTGTIGTDAIKVAFIYKPATVETVGAHAILDATVDPNFIDTKNRPVLAQTFKEKATGEIFTAAVNHLKSKGSDCDDLGDPDTGDGQANCNKTRSSAAVAEAQWLATDPTSSGDPDFLIIGDLNAYAMEDPVTALKEAGYRDLVARYGGAMPYSFVFFGQAGTLDHSLANPTLAGQIKTAAAWHINADEPNALNYNDFNQPGLYQPDAYRASDHDPVIVGLNLGQYPVFLPVVPVPGSDG